MVQRGMHTSVGDQAHEMDLLAIILRIRECALDLRVIHDGTLLASHVDLHQILVNNAAGTDIQVAHLRVTHLSVRQTHEFAASLQLGIWIIFQQRIPIRSWG